jgi:hypothetical protein
MELVKNLESCAQLDSGLFCDTGQILALRWQQLREAEGLKEKRPNVKSANHYIEWHVLNEWRLGRLADKGHQGIWYLTPSRREFLEQYTVDCQIP